MVLRGQCVANINLFSPFHLTVVLYYSSSLGSSANVHQRRYIPFSNICISITIFIYNHIRFISVHLPSHGTLPQHDVGQPFVRLVRLSFVYLRVDTAFQHPGFLP